MKFSAAISPLSCFRLIETDAKSMNSLQSGHSRRSSDTSQISVTSGSSSQEKEPPSEEEDLW